MRSVALDIPGAKVTGDIPAGARLIVPVSTDLAGIREDGQNVRIQTKAGVELKHQWLDPPPVNLIAGITNRNADPRLLEFGGRIYGSVVQQSSTLLYSVDAVTGRDGEVETLFSQNKDDHRTACVVPLPDGRVAAFQTGHGSPYVRNWIGTAPGRVEGMGPELRITPADERHCTHPQAWILEGMGNRVVVTVRLNVVGGHETWGVLWCDDLPTADPETGGTFTDPIDLVTTPQNAYVKAIKTGESRIDFQLVDGTPGTPETGKFDIYHFYLDDTGLCATDGTVLRPSLEDLAGEPLTLEEITKVYDHSEEGPAWGGWWVGRTPEGRAAMVWQTIPSAKSSPEDFSKMAYWWGVENGAGGWDTEKITDAGGAVSPEGQPPGAGGIVFNPLDPNEVFLSREVDGNHEIERWMRGADEAWGSEALTAGNTQPQFRPCPVYGRDEATPIVAHSAGEFFSGDEFETETEVWPAFPAPYERKAVRVQLAAKALSGQPIGLKAVWDEDAPAYEPHSFDIYGGEVLAAHNLVYREPGNFYFRDNRGIERATDSTPKVLTQIAHPLGRAMYFGGEGANGQVPFPKVDLSGLSELEIVAVVRKDRAGGKPCIIVTNFDTDEPGLQFRTKNNSNIVEARLNMAEDTIIGGEYPDLALIPGQWHVLVLRFKAGEGLKMKLDDVWSSTVYAAANPLDETAPANRGCFVGRSPSTNTENWYGGILSVEMYSKVRTEAEQKLDYLGYADELVEVGDLESPFTPYGWAANLGERDDARELIPFMLASMP